MAYNRHSQQQMHSKELLIGAAIGGILGGIGALMIAPKTGEELRQNIADTYHDLSEKSQNFTKKGRCFAKHLGCQSHDWTSKAKSLLGGLGRCFPGYCHSQEEECNTRDLLIGGLAGGLLGAVAGLLLAPKAGEDLREDIKSGYRNISNYTQDFAEDVGKQGRVFAKTARSKANRWLNLATQVIEELTDNVQEKGEEWVEDAKHVGDRLNEILDWASLGYRVWQGLNRKR